MARDLTVEVRQFTVAALRGPGAVSTIVGARSFGPHPPSPPEWPFVRTDLPVATPDSDGCGGNASRYGFNIHGFAKGEDERAAGALAAAIAAQMDGLAGPLVAEPDNAYLRDMVWTGTQIFRDTAEVNGWHAVVSVTALVSG